MDRKGIFTQGGPTSWQQNAALGRPHAGSWTYILGYRWAADAVVEDALATGRQDALIYPATFLYRHGLELALKQATSLLTTLLRLAQEAGSLDESEIRAVDKLENGPDQGHSLLKLKNRLTAAMKLITEEAFPEEVDAAINELHNFDPTGQTFRYSRLAKKHQPPSIPEPRFVDIENLKLLGIAIDFVADGLCGWLDNQIEGAREYIQELRDSVPYESGW